MDIQNTHCREVHLTDEQFAELLMGATPTTVQEHLKACAECAAEAERVADAIGSFEQQSRLWAERHAASRPVLSQDQRPSFAWASILARPQAWVTAVLAVAVGVGVAISTHHQPQQTATVVQTPENTAAPIGSQTQQIAAATQPIASANSHAARVTPSKLKADNDLLSAIDGALRAEATPESLYGLSVSSRTERVRSSERIAN